MNRKPVTIEEKAEFIRWIMTDDRQTVTDNKEEKTPEDYKLCRKLIKNDLDVTDKLLHDYMREGGSWLWIRNRQEILNVLFKAGRCRDIAMWEAEIYVNSLPFLPEERRMEFTAALGQRRTRSI